MSVKAAYDGNKPLSVLSDLIGKRQEWLKESAEDAVIATSIDVLNSLRTLSRSAKRRRGTKPLVEDCPGLVAGYTGGRGNPRRTLRLAAGGGQFSARRVKWLTAGRKNGEIKVFKVTPEHASVAPYYVAAHSMADAKKFENAASLRRMNKYGNLAKWAFGVAMNKLSTRNVHDDLTGEARLAGSRLSKVWKSQGFTGYTVRVVDALDYASEALRGGMSAVDVAMKKASNKIAGRLMHRFGDLLGSDFTTPFPEVARRRK